MGKMIKKIKIENFQSHRATEIEPSPGVNVIVGRNMTGKSALLRALRLLFFNKPEGSDFVSWGASNAEVEIEYGEHKIHRIKGKKTNIYKVDGSEFKSFGKGVPVEVARVLGATPIRIADSTYELTIGGPHEPPFLVSETDAVKGKIFAELAEHLLGDLVRLDKAISTANVKLRKMNSESSVLDGEITSTEEALALFSPIEGTAKKLKMCHDLLSRAQDIQADLNGLIDCREALGQINQDLSSVQGLSSIYALGNLDSQIEEAQKLQLELVNLTQVRTQRMQVSTSLSQLELRKTALEAIPDLTEAETLTKELADLMQVQSQQVQINESLSQLESRKVALEKIPDLTEAETLVAELQSLQVVALELDDINESMHRLCHDHSKVATELSFTVNDYGEQLLDEKQCPICFGPVTAHDAERIIKELTGNGYDGDKEKG